MAKAQKTKGRKKNPAALAAKHGRERRALRAAGFNSDAEHQIRMSGLPPNYAGPPRDYSLRKAGH